MSPQEDTKKVVNQTSSSTQGASMEIDPEIKEIFVEEARDVLSTLEEYFPVWQQDVNNKGALTETRRAFHTLKGSGRMVGADAIGELAWSVESLLNRVIDGRVEPGYTLLTVVSDVIALVPSMVSAFDAGNLDFDQQREARLRDAAIRLANGEDVILETAPAVEPPLVEALAEEIDPDLLEIFIAEARNHLAALADFTAGQEAKAPFFDYPSKPLQAALHTLKGSAHMANIQAIAVLATPLEKFVKELLNYQVRVDPDCIELFSDCEKYMQQVVNALAGKASVDTSELDSLVARVNELRERMLEHVLGQEASLAQVDPVFLNLLMADGMQMVLDAEKTLAAWQQGASDFDPGTLPTMAAELRELQSGAERAGFPALAQLSSAVAVAYDGFIQQAAKPDRGGFDLLLEAHDTLLNMADAVAAHQDVLPVEPAFIQRLGSIVTQPAVTAMPDIDVPGFAETELAQEAVDADREVVTLFVGEARDLLDEVDRAFENWKQAPGNLAHGHACNRLLHTLKGSARMAGLETLGSLAHDMETVVTEVAGTLAGSGLPLPQPLLAFPDRLHSALTLVMGQIKAAADVAKPAAPSIKLPADLDEEVIELFFGEAEELLEELEGTLQRWLEAPRDSTNADIIKRNLHTFKGGARMAGLLDLGEESHHYETFVIDNEVKVLKGDGGPIKEMLARYDRLQNNVEAVRQAYNASRGPVEEVLAPAAAQQPVWQTADILPFTGKYKGLFPQKQQAVSVDTQDASQEVVRIPAPVLDTLVNLAGESSISRSQVEQNINEFIHSLDEMEATIRRMHDQVRRLGIETDAQVMFRKEQIEASDNEAFDPLEMDRYSQLQQLARSLLESASDLQDLRDTLLDKSRDAESLLLQQSRINTDLQESLMRTRMVPFSRVVPRLRRVVRQVASTVGKQVQLDLGNVEGELDRSVLERIMAPLEHMLRNAIDHGIESEAVRRDLGKNPEGTISISFAREGADILIRLADDGRGLDVEAIRAKAFSLGLLNEHSIYTDTEVAQFIFHPGFSTAAEVTQTSGRGVGMDVVSSEVRQLGGSVTMTTQRGAGTEFLVRLPFTVSVNRALMIELGEDSYSLALNSISGVTRMSVEQLRRIYSNPQEKFEYGGEKYEVRYLGTLLSSDLRPNLDTTFSGQVPLVLTRIDNINYAVQVDALIGSREIVVKSLGAQFSRVPGLSGATVLGDGRVVVILDLQGLLRAQSAAVVLAATGAVVEEPVKPKVVELRDDHVQTIMVVDDSVTVRKVTSRFLEREGFRVVTARDGVDAMRALQETTPDLMLLDIEMPRMDGFEVARLVRSTQRLKDLPIIMITSRTGEKHRERALAMGVNQYLGKPYQEDVLIREVYKLLTTAETA